MHDASIYGTQLYATHSDWNPWDLGHPAPRKGTPERNEVGSQQPRQPRTNATAAPPERASTYFRWSPRLGGDLSTRQHASFGATMPLAMAPTALSS
eukprot:7534596-Pyramimonas_sp.AAC.1